VSVRRARTIEDLYEAVAAYDLVLTTDAPLSLALNRRIDTPRIGTFAATPRMLASGEFRPRDERTLFLQLVDETDLRWKHAAHLLENVLGCWEETGDLRAILEYETFDTAGTRSVLDAVEAAESAHKDLVDYSIPDTLSVAVVGEAQFTPLDRSVLPQEYDAVDPFETGEFDLPEFHCFSAATDIVDTVVDNVSPENAGDVAVIMDRGSAYPSLVESALDAADVPFYGGPEFADDEDLRTFLMLLRTAEADRQTRVVDVRPILQQLGVHPPVEDDEKFLHYLSHPDVEPLQQFCEDVPKMTFDEALRTFEAWIGHSLDDFRAELEQLGVSQAPIEAALDDVSFYLESFDVPVDRDDSGILLADATAAAYVDRPVVFYLGMDADWTHRVLDRPWVDTEAKDKQYLEQFQLLLQNGQQQYYLVQETSAGQPVTPCLYFHDLLDEEFDTFADLPSADYTRFSGRDRDGFEKVPVSAESETVEMLSQSSLRTFVNCPRDYFFDSLVESPDRDYFRKGNLFHDFAEFAVNHPDVVEATPREEIVDLCLAEMRPYVDDVDMDVLGTEFGIGLDVIRRYLAREPPVEREYDGYSQQWQDNFFADQFDQEITSSITERWFENPGLGGKGKVDLIQSPTTLLDYKSGRSGSAAKIVKDSAIDDVSDKPDFQALLYLANHRRVTPDEPLSFVFFHFLDLVDEEVVGEADLGDALVEVTYYPEPFEEFVTRQAAFEALCEGVAESNTRRKTLEKMGFEAYESFFEQHAFPPVDNTDELLDSDVAAAFTAFGKDAVGDYKYVESGTASALKELLKLRGRNYFEEDIDAFERFLDEQIDRVNEYRRSTFPVGDPTTDRINHRDLIPTDD